MRVGKYEGVWEPYMTARERIEAMEREIQGLKDQLAWNRDFGERLEKAIAEKQEALDLEAAELLKHK